MDFHRLSTAHRSRIGASRMRGKKTTHKAKPSSSAHSADVAKLQQAIRKLGDFAHIKVRFARGNLEICPDENPIARATPLGGGRYGLSFHSHTGRWEPMPFIGPLEELARDIVDALGPYLERRDFSDTNFRSDH